MENHSIENVFRQQLHFNAQQAHCRMKDFAGGLVLK